MEKTMQCSVRVGFYLKRYCNEPSTAVCERCARDICPAHSRPSNAGTFLCVECFTGPLSSRRDDDASDSFLDDGYSSGTSSSSSGFSSTEPSPGPSPGPSPEPEGGGGEFGGGGSSSGWTPAARIGGSDAPTPGNGGPFEGATEALERQGFTAEDIAAFDQVTAADKDRNDDLYDS